VDCEWSGGLGGKGMEGDSEVEATAGVGDPGYVGVSGDGMDWDWKCRLGTARVWKEGRGYQC